MTENKNNKELSDLGALPPGVEDHVMDVLCDQLGLDRRTFMRRGVQGVGGVLAMTALMQACKTRPEGDLAAAGAPATAASPVAPPPFVSSGNFLTDIDGVETKLAVKVPPTDPSFPAAAKALGGGVATVIGYWLKVDPYKMFDQLFTANPRRQFYAPKQGIGPVLIFRHADVIKAMKATDKFTVDKYASEMKKATEAETSPTAGFYDFYMLGTDNDSNYRPDGAILRGAVSHNDTASLRPMARKACEKQLATFKGGSGDLVTQMARYVPVTIVGDYLGVPSYEKGEKTFDPKLKGGDSFTIDPELTKFFKFQKITDNKGIVPTPQNLYDWVHDAFRNIFNNFGAKPEWRDAGLVATEYLTAYIHKLITHYKPLIRSDKLNLDPTKPVPMLIRLLQAQKLADDDKASGSLSLTAQAIGITQDEYVKRLSDQRIRSNVFGTAVGAVVNPEEGHARVFDTILALKEGKYKVPAGKPGFNDLEKAVKGPETIKSQELIRRFALEALRLTPQGEVVVRACVDGTNEFNVRAGSTVFLAIGAAMRDATVLKNPELFDVTRDPKLEKFKDPKSDDRKNEDPQSTIYLQHGFGRHKCLGRYASEMCLEEGLRAMLQLKNIKRVSPLQMDSDNLYAVSLPVTFG